MNVQELVENIAKYTVYEAHEIIEEYTHGAPYVAVESRLRYLKRSLKTIRNDLRKHSHPDIQVLDEAIEEITGILNKVSETEAETIITRNTLRRNLCKDLLEEA